MCILTISGTTLYYSIGTESTNLSLASGESRPLKLPERRVGRNIRLIGDEDESLALSVEYDVFAYVLAWASQVAFRRMAPISRIFLLLKSETTQCGHINPIRILESCTLFHMKMVTFDPFGTIC